MVSKIVVIADATKEAVGAILEALKTVHSDQLHVKVLFISRLSGVSQKNLGYNILTLLMREEQEALQKARIYLTINDIPYDIRITHGYDWQAVSQEIDAQEHDMLILQGEFAKIWRKEHPTTCGLRAINESVNPVWILKWPEESSAVSARP